MLLAIDSGNTNVVCAVYDGDELRGSWRAATNPNRTADEYAVWLVQLMALSGLAPKDIDATIIGSVVPEATFNLVRLCQRYFGSEPLMIGRPDCFLGIGVDLEQHVGAAGVRRRRAAAGVRPIDHHRPVDRAEHVQGMEVEMAEPVALRHRLKNAGKHCLVQRSGGNYAD